MELRGASSEPAPSNTDLWSFDELHEYRCWFLCSEGLEEIDIAEYRELIADKNFTGISDFSHWRFCFEQGYRVMVSSFRQTMGGFVMTCCLIAGDEDGKVVRGGGVTLAMT